MSRYHRLSVQEKQAESISAVRDHAVACPGCGTKLMPADLIAHVEQRCRGPLAPGPGAKWVTHREALKLGVPRATLSFWAKRSEVRFVGERQDRKYLFGDLALKMAQRRLCRRR